MYASKLFPLLAFLGAFFHLQPSLMAGDFHRASPAGFHRIFHSAGKFHEAADCGLANATKFHQRFHREFHADAGFHLA